MKLVEYKPENVKDYKWISEDRPSMKVIRFALVGAIDGIVHALVEFYENEETSYRRAQNLAKDLARINDDAGYKVMVVK